MGSSRISIITPVYNGGRFLSATLESIQNQTCRDWECIIVDDGSTDDSAKIAAQFGDLDSRFRVLRQANAGPCVARNHALEHIAGYSAYITFMDADDLWLPLTLDTRLPLIALRMLRGSPRRPADEPVNVARTAAGPTGPTGSELK